MRTNKTARVTLVVLLVAVMSFATVATPGTAQTPQHDHPPNMDLRWPGHSMQAGTQWSYCWRASDEPGMCADMVGGFPRAMWVRSGALLKVRIHRADKPKDFGGTTWRHVDEDGVPQGQGRDLNVTLKPVVRNGQTRAWDAVFRLNGPRHHYIMVFGVWPQGDASWRFHVRTLGDAAAASPPPRACATRATASTGC